jgi:hypothetical protein
MGSPVRRHIILFAALSLMVVAALAQPASGVTTTKKFAADVSPDCAGAGVDTTFTLTLVNESKQQLGSVNLNVPSNTTGPLFTLNGSSGTVSPTGTATVVGNVLEIRNLSLQSNHTATVTFQATTATAAGAYTWGIFGKQSNDFNGNPGNDFILNQAHSDLGTFVSCRLDVVRQPADAEKNVNITSGRFDATALPVQVQVLQPIENIRVTTSNDAITIGLDPNVLHPTAQLSPAASPANTVNAVAGLATFFSSGNPSLTIDTSGTYSLNATNPKMVTAHTGAFTIYDDVSSCRAHQACPQVDASDANTSVSVLANASNTAGFAFAAMDAEAPITCDGYQSVSGTATFGASSDRSKTVIVTVDKSLAPSRVVGQYQFCYSSEFLGFTDRFGHQVGPGGTGLLADCGKNVPLPCLDSVQGGSTTVTLTALVPPGATRGRT